MPGPSLATPHLPESSTLIHLPLSPARTTWTRGWQPRHSPRRTFPRCAPHCAACARCSAPSTASWGPARGPWSRACCPVGRGAKGSGACRRWVVRSSRQPWTPAPAHLPLIDSAFPPLRRAGLQAGQPNFQRVAVLQTVVQLLGDAPLLAWLGARYDHVKVRRRANGRRTGGAGPGGIVQRDKALRPEASMREDRPTTLPD